MEENFFDELPDVPELAFLKLEELFYETVLEEEEGLNPGQAREFVYIEYMTRTIAASRELELEFLKNWERPSSETFNIGQYFDFRHDVVAERTALLIRFGRRTRPFSVRLDAKAKQTIHFHIGQIRELIEAAELDDQKKERLVEKLGALAVEVDRDRTRFESFGAAVIEFSGVLGEAAEKLEPARKWLDSIARLIWGAKEEEKKSLPAPAQPKRIPPPKPQDQRGSKSSDEEIPF